MTRNLYVLSQLPEQAQAGIAGYVAGFTTSPSGVAAELLPLQPEDVRGRLGFVACVGNRFVGYAGVKPLALGETGIELGPFIVPPSSRRQGHGAALLARAVHSVVELGQMPYVFGNEANLGNLTRIGFIPVEISVLAPETYQTCDPGGNTPVALIGPPAWEDVALDEWPRGEATLQLPQEF